MMVETMLDSSQDFGMSGALPQWKRELLQRRAARARPPAPPPPPPPPPEPEVAEELRYGPGIVKRLKSRYLSLALREAPRRRASVLRRAASLEHLLDERPPAALDHLLDERPPAAPRAPRPASLAAPLAAPPVARRELVKRARSVDALSRLEAAREEPPSPPAPPPRPVLSSQGRAARPPRRPTPLLREAERPPPDVVRSALRKFESAPTRRTQPAARLPAVLRGRERRSSTPEREPEREPSPAPASPPPLPASPAPPPLSLSEPESLTPDVAPLVLKTPEPEVTSPKVPTVIAPKVPTVAPPKIPAAASSLSPVPAVLPAPVASPRTESPVPGAGAGAGAEAGVDEVECAAARPVSRAALEGIARAGSSVRFAFEAVRGGSHLPPLAATNPVLVARRVGVIRPMPAEPRVNGHSTPEPRALSRIGAAGIERAWSGSTPSPAGAPWLRGKAPRVPPAATSVVFNFSGRKEVPDYIENDGIILRAARRDRLKAGDPGVVVLRPEALTVSTELECEEDGGPPSPCSVRFVNDNVLINGRSSMLRDPARTHKLKLQFDDSLTRTFEYPSEMSLCEDEPTAPAPAPASPAPAPASPAPAPAVTSPPPAANQQLADNTHIASAVLSRYTPSKTAPAAFQLGLAPPTPAPSPAPAPNHHEESMFGSCGAEGEDLSHAAPCGADAVPCGADVARSWSEARLATDLLF